MERLLQADRDVYVKAMRQEVDQILGQVMDAVNAAPTGQVINKSEFAVRDLMARLRERAYEVAVQMRVDVTEASFSPSAWSGGQGSGKQGETKQEQPERQRAHQY